MQGTFGLVCKLTPKIKEMLDKRYGDNGNRRVAMALDALVRMPTPDGRSQTTVQKSLVYWDPYNTTDMSKKNMLAGFRGREDAQKWKAGLQFLHRNGVGPVWVQAIMRRLAGQIVEPEPLFWIETGVPTEPLWAKEVRRFQIEKERQCDQQGLEHHARQRYAKPSTPAASSPRISSAPLERANLSHNQLPLTPPTSSPITALAQKSSETHKTHVQRQAVTPEANQPTSKIPKAQNAALQESKTVSSSIKSDYNSQIVGTKPRPASKSAPGGERIAAIKARQEENKNAGLKAMRPTPRVQGHVVRQSPIIGSQVEYINEVLSPKPRDPTANNISHIVNQVEPAGNSTQRILPAPVTHPSPVIQNDAKFPQPSQRPEFTPAQIEEIRRRQSEMIMKEWNLQDNLSKVNQYRAAVEEEYDNNIRSKSQQEAEKVRAQRMKLLYMDLLRKAQHRATIQNEYTRNLELKSRPEAGNIRAQRLQDIHSELLKKAQHHANGQLGLQSTDPRHTVPQHFAPGHQMTPQQNAYQQILAQQKASQQMAQKTNKRKADSEREEDSKRVKQMAHQQMVRRQQLAPGLQMGPRLMAPHQQSVPGLQMVSEFIAPEQQMAPAQQSFPQYINPQQLFLSTNGF